VWFEQGDDIGSRRLADAIEAWLADQDASQVRDYHQTCAHGNASCRLCCFLDGQRIENWRMP
jgi:hypothetical protein